MKLNYHKAPLYLYLQIQETDGLRKVTLFEDFDETFLNYNLNCNLKKFHQNLRIRSLFSTHPFPVFANKDIMALCGNLIS